MTNERFYPAKERKNDFIINNVNQIQLGKEINHTIRKSVLNGKVLLGFKCYDTTTEQRGLHTIIEHIYN